jgi:hypothetical protein
MFRAFRFSPIWVFHWVILKYDIPTEMRTRELSWTARWLAEGAPVTTN